MTPRDILAAIDAATGCQWCGGVLAGSVSPDFCCEACQEAWHAQHGEPLPVPAWTFHENCAVSPALITGERFRLLA